MAGCQAAGVSFGIGSSDGDCYALGNPAFSAVGVKSIGLWSDLQPTFVTSKGFAAYAPAGAEARASWCKLDSSGRTVLASSGDKWNGDAPAGGGFEIHCPEHDGRCGYGARARRSDLQRACRRGHYALSAGDAISGLER